ncbi:MAG: Smr/MutS family protein [Marinosulfonomonas sp.]|nr:Smr/MutS family protein [Marinosulfonomonas sp.]
MSRRKPRGLRPDEEEIWDRVRRTAVPMHVGKKMAIRDAIESPKPKVKPRVAHPSIAHFQIGQAATAIRPPVTAASQPPVQMDHKSFGRMKKGKLSPEGRIDLHGMTLAQAHPAVTRFILDAHASGKRLVLVITGKGKRRDGKDSHIVRPGVLKHQLPHWLHSAPLKSVILQVSEAHLRHGGSGAYYVYLRRSR